MLHAAIKRGQLQTAASILDSLARQVGCDEPTATESLPEIRVRVEPPAQMTGSEATQLPPIDVTQTEDVEND